MSRCSSSRSLIWCQIHVWQHFCKAGGQDLCRFSEKTCCHDLFTAPVIANTRQVEHVDLLWEMDPVTSVGEKECRNGQEVKNSGVENNVPVNARHSLHPQTHLSLMKINSATDVVCCRPQRDPASFSLPSHWSGDADAKTNQFPRFLLSAASLHQTNADTDQRGN